MWRCPSTTPGRVSTSKSLRAARWISAKLRICACANLMSSMVRGDTWATRSRMSASDRRKLGGDHWSKRSLSSRTAWSPRARTSAMMPSTVARVLASASSWAPASAASLMWRGIGGLLEAPLLLPLFFAGNLQLRQRFIAQPAESTYATILAILRSRLFDDLVGARRQQLRHGEAESVGGFLVDDQLELGRAVDRQIARLVAFQNPPDIGGVAAIGVGKIGSIAHQSAALGGCSAGIDRRDRMLRRQRDDLRAAADKERPCSDNERAGALFGERGERGVDLGWRAGLGDDEPATESARSGLGPFRLRQAFRIVRVRQQGDDGRRGNQFMQQLQPFTRQIDREPGDPG